MKQINHAQMCGLVFGVLASCVVAQGASAADVAPGIVTAARCAPRATSAIGSSSSAHMAAARHVVGYREPLQAAGDPTLRVIGSQDTTVRMLYGTRDLLIINAGTGRGVQLGQQYSILHPGAFGTRTPSSLHAITTAGWLRVIAANETTAIGLVEFACDGIERGDYLEPYVEPVLPDGIDRTETAGETDFTQAARVLFGTNERITAGTGDYMAIDAGTGRGFASGSRFAIYRDLGLSGVPLTPLGEAVAVFTDAGTSVVRITKARDAVRAGDLVIPRK
jgi:hypothetical protein